MTIETSLITGELTKSHKLVFIVLYKKNLLRSYVQTLITKGTITRMSSFSPNLKFFNDGSGPRKFGLKV